MKQILAPLVCSTALLSGCATSDALDLYKDVEVDRSRSITFATYTNIERDIKENLTCRWLTDKDEVPYIVDYDLNCQGGGFGTVGLRLYRNEPTKADPLPRVALARLTWRNWHEDAHITNEKDTAANFADFVVARFVPAEDALAAKNTFLMGEKKTFSSPTSRVSIQVNPFDTYDYHVMEIVGTTPVKQDKQTDKK